MPTNVISPSEGGAITTTVGVTVSIVFAPGTVVDPVEVVIEPVTDTHAHGDFQVVGQIFQITAHTLAGVPVTTFNPPFILTIHYDSLPVGTRAPPILYFWQESDERWVEIPATYDPDAHTLTAVLNHLTTFAVMQQENFRVYVPMLLR
jgi:hypothetical protein